MFTYRFYQSLQRGTLHARLTLEREGGKLYVDDNIVEVKTGLEALLLLRKRWGHQIRPLVVDPEDLPTLIDNDEAELRTLAFYGVEYFFDTNRKFHIDLDSVWEGEPPEWEEITSALVTFPDDRKSEFGFSVKKQLCDQGLNIKFMPQSLNSTRGSTIYTDICEVQALPVHLIIKDGEICPLIVYSDLREITVPKDLDTARNVKEFIDQKVAERAALDWESFFAGSEYDVVRVRIEDYQKTVASSVPDPKGFAVVQRQANTLVLARLPQNQILRCPSNLKGMVIGTKGWKIKELREAHKLPNLQVV